MVFVFFRCIANYGLLDRMAVPFSFDLVFSWAFTLSGRRTEAASLLVFTCWGCLTSTCVYCGLYVSCPCSLFYQLQRHQPRLPWLALDWWLKKCCWTTDYVQYILSSLNFIVLSLKILRGLIFELSVKYGDLISTITMYLLGEYHVPRCCKVWGTHDWGKEWENGHFSLYNKLKCIYSLTSSSQVSVSE